MGPHELGALSQPHEGGHVKRKRIEQVIQMNEEELPLVSLATHPTNVLCCAVQQESDRAQLSEGSAAVMGIQSQQNRHELSILEQH